ncbi:MAG: hypothetical protein WBP88_11005 [Nitrososphaeraceae archaeon]
MLWSSQQQDYGKKLIPVDDIHVTILASASIACELIQDLSHAGLKNSNLDYIASWRSSTAHLIMFMTSGKG